MKNFCYVYWAHLKEHTDIFSEGYVGFTSRTPEERLREHIQESGHPNKNLTHFHRALKKYKDDIVLDTVCISTEKYCLDVEYRLRPKDRVGWNCVPGGGKPPSALGKSFPNRPPRGPVSEETRQKLRDSHVLRLKVSEETKKKISKALTGRKPSEESLLKARETRRLSHIYVKLSNERALLLAETIYDSFVAGIPPGRTLSKTTSVSRPSLKAMYVLFNDGWIPRSDSDYIQWKKCNEFNVPKDNRQSVERRAKTIYANSLWRSKSANTEVWMIAEELFSYYISNEQCGDRMIAKAFGGSRASYSSICKWFKAGWNPLEDDEYKAWKSGSCTGGATGSSGNSSDMNSDNKA